MPQPRPPLDLTIRCGFEFGYHSAAPTPALLLIKPQPTARQAIRAQRLRLEPRVDVEESVDLFGNLVHRVILPTGSVRISMDSLIAVPSTHEHLDAVDEPHAIADLSPKILRFTLPSRYCDSDKLLDFAFQRFGQVPHGLRRVQAICDWVHENIEYRFGSGSPLYAASDVINQRFGVCRDFAHVSIALCRCFNLPARYVTGYLPDVGYQDPGTPMDFHAYFQVYVGGRWHTYDARFNVPRLARIHICHGLDGVDAASATFYGAAQLTWFNVWAYQVDPSEVQLGDPLDLSKRLDGTPEVRIPPSADRRVSAAV